MTGKIYFPDSWLALVDDNYEIQSSSSFLHAGGWMEPTAGSS